MATDTTTQITLPTLAEGASLKLTDLHKPDDNVFITQYKGDKARTGSPVDAVLVDHMLVDNEKGNSSLRCLFVVLQGKDVDGADVTGKNVVCDMALGEASEPYTYANMRLMGMDFADVDAAVEALRQKPNDAAVQKAAVTAQEAFVARMNDASKSGAGKKVLHVKTESKVFNNKTYVQVPLGGVTQPAARLDNKAATTKLGVGLLAKLAASKAGPPKKDFGDDKGGASQPRNPTSAPPSAVGGPVGVDDPIPF